MAYFLAVSLFFLVLSYILSGWTRTTSSTDTSIYQNTVCSPSPSCMLTESLRNIYDYDKRCTYQTTPCASSYGTVICNTGHRIQDTGHFIRDVNQVLCSCCLPSVHRHSDATPVYEHLLTSTSPWDGSTMECYSITTRIYHYITQLAVYIIFPTQGIAGHYCHCHLAS